MKPIVLENELPIWIDWSLQPTEDKPAIPAITHGTKEVCVASNNDWLDHLYITLHYQNRALVIWSMILLLAAERDNKADS